MPGVARKFVHHLFEGGDTICFISMTCGWNQIRVRGKTDTYPLPQPCIGCWRVLRSLGKQLLLEHLLLLLGEQRRTSWGLPDVEFDPPLDGGFGLLKAFGDEAIGKSDAS
jgi:hypothetical protein